MRTLIALVALLMPVASSLWAAEDWMQEGNEAFYNLDYDQSIASYEKALAASPEDPILHNHLAHALLYRELFRDGALESELVSGNNSFHPAPEAGAAGGRREAFFRRDRPGHATQPGADCEKSARHRGAARLERLFRAAGQLRVSGAQELEGFALGFQSGA